VCSYFIFSSLTFFRLSADSSSSVVVAGYNVSAPAGSSTVLQCVSGRMVWTRDAVRDRQRVVHWDMYRPEPDYAMERVVDMFSSGDQRIYNSYNPGRVGLNPTAFKDGNFSLVIKDVTMNDRGLYSCNLHHLYCHLHETIRVQLNVTKSRMCRSRPARADDSTDSSAMRRRTSRCASVGLRQSPGIRHDSADRLVDLYASGEQRRYGAPLLQRKMNISDRAFAEGDFSLTIFDLQPTDQGVYSCHLHHHYCGLHERRVFQLTVEPTVPSPKKKNKLLTAAAFSRHSDATKAESPRVITVILPEQRHHFLLPLGYVLTSFLLLAFIILIVILVTRRRRTKEFYPQSSMRSSRSHSSSDQFEMDVAEVNACSREEGRFGESEGKKTNKQMMVTDGCSR
uniref:Matrix remodeling-associated protein 8 n=1 Tax=Salarias fasciatus TaxID=181472 RepID=A0A672ILN1_SALFA